MLVRNKMTSDSDSLLAQHFTTVEISDWASFLLEQHIRTGRSCADEEFLVLFEKRIG
ncbi:MAG: hypothetical protein O6837_02795 [Deltaproteobacteria bacterium]|nr:hypothetical protein [Deltaproteobacteria bacterium]MCZ6547033.1 hypothetical protein [Deltaproteobacteria bacterium]